MGVHELPTTRVMVNGSYPRVLRKAWCSDVGNESAKTLSYIDSWGICSFWPRGFGCV